jgi:hypothetical protein
VNNRSRKFFAACVGAALATSVMAGELSRLTADVLDSEGHTASLRAVLGIGALSQRDAWDVWSEAQPGRIGGWVAWHAVAELIFWLAAALILLRLLGSTLLGRVLVWVLVVVELVRALVLLLAGVLLAEGHPTVLAWPIALLSTAGWIAGACVVIFVLRSDPVRTSLLARARLWLRALKYQRLSAVPVALLGVLSFVSGPNIWDQVPDVERSWVDSWRAARDGGVAALAVLLVAAALFFVGRRRALRAEKTNAPGGGPPGTDAEDAPSYRVWLIGPAVVLAAALALKAWGPDGTVSHLLVRIFALVPIGLVVVSVVLRACGVVWEETALPALEGLVPATRRLGDGLALALVAVLGIGIVRSFTAPVFSDPHGTRHSWEIAVFVLGLLLAAGAVPAGAFLIGAVAPQPPFPRTGAIPGGWTNWFLVLMVVAAGVLVAALCDPLGFSTWLGPYGLLVSVLGAWVALLSGLVVYLQDRRPLELFGLLRLRAAPVLSLFVAVPVLATLAPSEPALHYVRSLPGGPAAVGERPDLTKRFGTWLTQNGACAVTAPDGTLVRPMLVVAASGGGIRAAVWTASVMDRLNNSGSCGEALTLLSSGVSGGSVGLVLARQSAQPENDARRLARPQALSAVLSGTLVGDLVAGSAGIRVPPARRGDDPARWLDRAGLMERAWERTVPELREPWTPEVTGPGGALVLNSTAANLGCRVLVSQLNLSVGQPATGLSPRELAQDCRARSGQPAGSLDFFTTYGTCSPRLSWATAAMLSARFPTVTPAGRVPRKGACEDDTPDLQLVDGGYAESSGVGTLADLAPRLAELVREYNVSRGPGQPVVVPLVAYLEDEVRSDVAERAPKEGPELLVPLAGRKAKGELSATRSHLQRVAAAFADVCQSAASDCSEAQGWVHKKIPDAVVLVGPSTVPSVTAPLGWMLSRASLTQLQTALDREAGRCDLRTQGAYASLGALLGLLPSGPCTELAH